jgi:hypothetical protein
MPPPPWPDVSPIKVSSSSAGGAVGRGFHFEVDDCVVVLLRPRHSFFVSPFPAEFRSASHKMNIEELVRPETKKHVAHEHEHLHQTVALSCMSLCGLPLNTTYACGFMWAATKTHLIHAGGVDVGRATRSRPIYNHNGHIAPHRLGYSPHARPLAAARPRRADPGAPAPPPPFDAHGAAAADMPLTSFARALSLFARSSCPRQASPPFAPSLPGGQEL